MKYYKSVLAILMFIAVLFAVYVVHVKFFRVNVILYSAILDAVIAAAVSTAILLMVKPFKLFSGFEKTQLVAIWLLGGYIFAISIPTVIDRSLSFYILEKLQQRGGGILENKMPDVFTQEYLVEDRLVDVRLTEQTQSGTVVIQNGCVKLTPWGYKLAKFSSWFRANMLPKQRLLAGQYTDALTNPFRDSKDVEDYKCH